MTSPNTSTAATKWQQQYSAGQSQWQDMKRMGEISVVIAFLLVIATLYMIGYAANQFDHWLFETPSQTFFYLFLLRVLLVILTPTIILFVVLRFIFRQAGELIHSIYNPKADENVSNLIRVRLTGIAPFPPPLNTIIKYPAVIITKPELDDNHWARWLGGPAILVINDGFAVYLERGNKFSRVVGPSFPPPFLERYERIKEIVDLRPQNRKGYVKPWTKDGIDIKLNLNIEVQIDASAEALEKSTNIQYPFDPLAVKAAVEYTSVRSKDGTLQEQNWLDGAWGSITGAINGFVAGHSLDELFVAPLKNNHSNGYYLSHETPENIEQIFSQTILEQVTNDVRNRLQHNGIDVLNIQITKLEVPQTIIDLRTRYWESARLKISAQRNSHAEAERIRARELAHAEAQRTMLTTIINKLEKVDPDDLTESLILSLSGILDQNLEDPIIRPLIAKEAFAVLDRMRKLLHERF
jgi:hypothetical protein